jgi:hypothetical protein
MRVDVPEKLTLIFKISLNWHYTRMVRKPALIEDLHEVGVPSRLARTKRIFERVIVDLELGRGKSPYAPWGSALTDSLLGRWTGGAIV